VFITNGLKVQVTLNQNSSASTVELSDFHYGTQSALDAL
jgi:hypothetical protein